jgi:phage major head subunit gpT-like protein
MNRSTFNKVTVPGLFSMMLMKFQERPEVWRSLVNTKTSTRAYEESSYYTGFGYVPVKPEGQGIEYDEPIQGPTKRWTHKTYGLGFKVTEEMIEDDLYDVMNDMASGLGHSVRETKEVNVADIFNNGFGTSSHTAGDGLAIFSNSHLRLGGGTWSNTFANAVDLNAGSLQQAVENFETTTDDRSMQQVLVPRVLLVAPQNEWKARELLYTQQDPESANNTINAIRSRNLQLVVWYYLTDPDAWFVLGEQHGLIYFDRRGVTFAKDGDFDTGDAKFKTTYRDSVEVNKPYGMYGSPGA